MSEANTWYIVKQADGRCTIVTAAELAAGTAESDQWGPFASEGEAIARRVGLIRAGKCQPS
jgi:hypothetical protein